MIRRYEPYCDFFLLDTSVKGLTGGTGVPHDWEVSRRLVESTRKRTFLAGGLTPDNVSNAIRTVQPYGVDTNSGVKSPDGRKDRIKIHDFITVAHG